jgi:mitochondrial fission protein ELM1
MLLSWIFCDGKIGTMNQCQGLADTLGLAPEIKVSHARLPWRWLPATHWPAPLAAQSSRHVDLSPPWPDLMIASSRSAIPTAAAMRRRAGKRMIAVAIQDPRITPAAFDLVIAAIHDRVRGPNVLVTDGALHRITKPLLAAAAERFRPLLGTLPRPLVAVLLGGSNRHFRLDGEAASLFGRRLASLAERTGAGFAITPSRRTSPEAVSRLAHALGDVPATIWDGKGENPYLGLLALADHVIVTADSVSMNSEAAATGKPVHVLGREHIGGRFADFHIHFAELGITRPFEDRLDEWSYQPPRDNERAAEAVGELLHRAGLAHDLLAPV